MFIWIARDDDKTNDIALFKERPDKSDRDQTYEPKEGVLDGSYIELANDLFPEIKPGECRKFKLVEVK